MRTFIAWPLPGELNARVNSLTAAVRTELPAASWTRTGLHMTLAFIGDLSREALPPLVEALERELSSLHGVPAEAGSTGFFPGIRRARVAWLGIRADQRLDAIAGGVRTALRAVGCPFDGKPFVPHVTLARIKRPWSESDASRLAVALKPVEGTPVLVDEVVVFESTLSPRGAVHTRVATVRLSSEALSRPE